MWIQYWVQLDTPEKAAAYRQYLTNYSDQQRAAGRFERPTNVRLRNVMEWLDYSKVVPGDVRLQVWLAFGFLLVCLLNTVGLLLAKFLRRCGEIGVRRALGASRRAIFAQCLIEAGTVGLAGGVLGLGLAMLGLWAVRQQPAELCRTGAPGPGDAADDLRAGHRRQPAGRAAAGLAGDAGHAGHPAQVAMNAFARSQLERTHYNGESPWNIRPILSTLLPAQDRRRADRAGDRAELRDHLQRVVPDRRPPRSACSVLSGVAEKRDRARPAHRHRQGRERRSADQAAIWPRCAACPASRPRP